MSHLRQLTQYRGVRSPAQHTITLELANHPDICMIVATSGNDVRCTFIHIEGRIKTMIRVSCNWVEKSVVQESVSTAPLRFGSKSWPAV